MLVSSLVTNCQTQKINMNKRVSTFQMLIKIPNVLMRSWSNINKLTVHALIHGDVISSRLRWHNLKQYKTIHVQETIYFTLQFNQIH